MGAMLGWGMEAAACGSGDIVETDGDTDPSRQLLRPSVSLEFRGVASIDGSASSIFSESFGLITSYHSPVPAASLLASPAAHPFAVPPAPVVDSTTLKPLTPAAHARRPQKDKYTPILLSQHRQLRIARRSFSAAVVYCSSIIALSQSATRVGSFSVNKRRKLLVPAGQRPPQRVAAAVSFLGGGGGILWQGYGVEGNRYTTLSQRSTPG
eukprot:GHVU01157869.1.p1 GENE.GHVU01157869.1~~GHVU01157869.1.p1  ORF type:complete len:210 (-),score=19.30 GHVU01157869.1:81-710(-)